MKAPESLIADLWRDYIGADPDLPDATTLPRVIPLDAADLRFPCISITVIRAAHKNPKCYKLEVHVRLIIETQPAPTVDCPSPIGTAQATALGWLQIIDARVRDYESLITWYMANLSEDDRTGWEIVKIAHGTAVEVTVNSKEHSRGWDQTITMWLAVD